MHVPLIVDVPPNREPQRTADVFASAIDLLRLARVETLDGRSFLR
jgi:hypothetical protein